MKKTTKKLAFSTETVRQLQQTMSEDELQGVAGGTVVILPQPGFGNLAPIAPRRPPGGINTISCPSGGNTLNCAC